MYVLMQLTNNMGVAFNTDDYCFPLLASMITFSSVYFSYLASCSV